MTLRRNFVASYATMCVAHWLAGVGDRHLQNTLVRVTTGRCLGIDFGHAFGGGLRAAVPELVPFRLTPQILELLRPFTERDLLATIMTHAMRALRDDRGPILACMDIFVHKPVNRSSLDDEMTRSDDQKDDAGNVQNEDVLQGFCSLKYRHRILMASFRYMLSNISNIVEFIHILIYICRDKYKFVKYFNIILIFFSNLLLF